MHLQSRQHARARPVPFLTWRRLKGAARRACVRGHGTVLEGEGERHVLGMHGAAPPVARAQQYLRCRPLRAAGQPIA
eukprot:15472183-Alexandrium_andersonii.AAC.1